MLGMMSGILNPRYRMGQAGGFPLHMSWLPFLEKIGRGRAPFEQSFRLSEKMGIGPNMVKSMKMWARAAGMVDDEYRLTERSRLFFGDPESDFLHQPERGAMWLVNWLICSNISHFTANGWLLNFYRAKSFAFSEALDAFETHLKSAGQPYAKGTIRVDLETAIRSYVSSPFQDAPGAGSDGRYFSRMGVLSSDRRRRDKAYYSKIFLEERPLLPSWAMVYAVIDAMEKRGVNTSSLSDLYALDDAPAPGVVFGLTEDGFMGALEKAQRKFSKIFSMSHLPGGDFQIALKKGVILVKEKTGMSAADRFYSRARQR